MEEPTIYMTDKMPERCGECRLCVDLEGKTWLCAPMSLKVDMDDKGRPDWCPREEFPKTRESPGKFKRGFERGYYEGWNSCLNMLSVGSTRTVRSVQESEKQDDDKTDSEQLKEESEEATESDDKEEAK